MLSMNCTNCGAELREGKKFCPNCGAPAARSSQCANCGATLAPGTAFCTGCGSRQGMASASPAPARPATEPPSSLPDPPSTTDPPAPPAPGGPGSSPSTGLSRPPRAALARAVPGVEFKGVKPRLLAALVDAGLCYLLAWYAAISLGGVSSATGFQLQWIHLLLASLGAGAYYVLLEGFLGITLGKLALGMRVVNGRGRAPGPAPALTRNLLRLVDFLPAFYLLGLLLVATTRERQRLGDRLAGTFVVSRKGAAAMRAAGIDLKGAGRTSLVLAAIVLFLFGGAYLLWSQPGPTGQLFRALPGLPFLGGLIPK